MSGPNAETDLAQLDRREQIDLRDEVRGLMRTVGNLVHRVEAVPQSALIIGTDQARGSFRSQADKEKMTRDALETELRRGKAGLSNALLILEGRW